MGAKGKNVNGETRNTDRLRHCLINKERWLGKRYENLLKHFSESKILVFKYSSLVHIFHSFSPFNSNKIPYLSHKSKKKRRYHSPFRISISSTVSLSIFPLFLLFEYVLLCVCFEFGLRICKSEEFLKLGNRLAVQYLNIVDEDVLFLILF